ncbi:MAG: hypothetical protein R3C45_17195 [Phycisphaerales bacterium]
MKRFLVLILVLSVTLPVFARNIDLSTVPSRDTVQLTIYNAEDLTLVRETRVVTFKKGVNPLQFSWANTLIDPTSVELRFLARPDELTVLDTTYPHDKPQMLYWNVASEFSGEAKVEITYFTSGITWSADYTGITDPDEQSMRLEGFVTVTNNSGEDYENAQVRLVVGTINLVEKIEQLARRGMLQAPAAQGGYGGLADDRKRLMRREAVRGMVMEADAMFADAAAPMAAKEIIKEGLSEYFIFTIEGSETVPNQWSKRMRSFDAGEVPVKVQYRYRADEYGDQLVRMFLLTNDKGSDLGESPLPDGIVRLFRRNESGTLSYLTAQSVKYIPIGDKIELNLGVDPNVVFELIDLRVFRDNIWGTFGTNVRRQFDEPGVRIEDRGRVEGWDEHTVFAQRIRNYTGKPIDLEIRRAVDGDATFINRVDATRHDYRTVQFTTSVKPGETRDVKYEVVQRMGSNQKQNRVEIEVGDPAPVPWLE